MIHPDDTFTVYLDGKDHEDTSPSRPAIVVRRGTAAEWRTQAAAVGEAFETRGGEYIDRLIASMSPMIVAFRNVPDDDLAALLSLRELRLLAGGLMSRADLQDTDRGNSESPSPSPAAVSAESATQQSAGVAA